MLGLKVVKALTTQGQAMSMAGYWVLGNEVSKINISGAKIRFAR